MYQSEKEKKTSLKKWEVNHDKRCK